MNQSLGPGLVSSELRVICMGFSLVVRGLGRGAALGQRHCVSVSWVWAPRQRRHVERSSMSAAILRGRAISVTTSANTRNTVAAEPPPAPDFSSIEDRGKLARRASRTAMSLVRDS